MVRVFKATQPKRRRDRKRLRFILAVGHIRMHISPEELGQMNKDGNRLARRYGIHT